MRKRGLAIYGDFIPFCMGNDESFYNSDSEAESSEFDSSELEKKIIKQERSEDWIRNYVEEQTDSSDSDYDCVTHESPIYPKKMICKVKCVKKKSGKKKVR